MHSLETIKAINNPPPKVHTPWNRDSSFCQTPRGVVIHSAVHRSTAFIDPIEHAESFASFKRFKRSKRALNAWIPAIVGGLDLESADKVAEQAKRKGRK